jgi:hypothetical protein
VLLQLDTGVYYGLDDVGTRVWQLIVELGDLEAVLEVLLSEYDVERERLEADIERLVGELEVKGLVVRDSISRPEA